MDYRLPCFECSLDNMPEDEYIIPIGAFAEHNDKYHLNATEFCRFCPMRFYSKENKFAHEQIDHDQFPCLQCFRDQQELFLDEDDFGNHVLHQHPLCKEQCNVCPNYFSSERLRDSHVELWHVNLKTLPSRCIHCNASIKRRHMNCHNKAVHKGWDDQCGICLCVFRSSGERDVHRRGCNI